MSKEQIEEMAEVLRRSCENECFKNKDGFADCEACEACLLYDAGYRKQSEVAREIFEEIERYVIKGISVGGEHLTLFNGKNYAELKKKYTEGKEGEGNDV